MLAECQIKRDGPNNFLLGCMCTQRRLRSACASAQSDQSLRCLPEAKECLTKTQIRLRGCTGLTETPIFLSVVCSLFLKAIFFITKTCLYNFYPLKPHFYVVKLGFTGVYIIFLICAQKHRLGVLVRTASPRRFKRVPTIYVLSRNMKNIRIFFI